MPESDDDKTVYLTFDYSISASDDAPAAFPMAISFLPESEKYQVVTDAASPAGATTLKYGDTVITLDHDKYPNAKIQVEILNPTTANWLRMEVPYARDIFSRLEVLYDVNYIIPEYAEFATSAGAALCGMEE